MKLVLIEKPGAGGTLNHLGVEVDSTDEIVAATRRLAEAGLPTEVEDGTTCCYALQDKVWATGPGGERWEVYTVLADAGTEPEGKTLAEVGSVSTPPPAPPSLLHQPPPPPRPVARSAAAAELRLKFTGTDLTGRTCVS